MNVAEILKYCPKGTKLYSTVFGEVKFFEIYTTDNTIVVIIKDDCKRVFNKDGSYSKYGECVLFPAKNQKDWSKFRLPVKKGDIMMSDGRAFIISDDYADTFIGAYHKYICGIDTTGAFKVSQSDHHWTNSFYIPASEEAKKELFDKMKDAGYRWNANTLELEKIEPEFKEGDVYINKEGDLYLVVGKIAKDIGKAAILYANGDFTAEAAFTITSDGLTLAKSSARNKLFSFLIRRGYKYDKVQHNIMKQCFTPFDRVLVRNNNTDSWKADIYLGYDENNPFPYICTRTSYSICIPYGDNEYLLGTTNSPE